MSLVNNGIKVQSNTLTMAKKKIKPTKKDSSIKYSSGTSPHIIAIQKELRELRKKN